MEAKGGSFQWMNYSVSCLCPAPAAFTESCQAELVLGWTDNVVQRIQHIPLLMAASIDNSGIHCGQLSVTPFSRGELGAGVVIHTS